MNRVVLKFTGESWRDDWADKPDELNEIGKLPSEFVVNTNLSYFVGLGVRYQLVIHESPDTYMLMGEVCDVFYNLVGNESEEIEVEVDLIAVYHQGTQELRDSEIRSDPIDFAHKNYWEPIDITKSGPMFDKSPMTNGGSVDLEDLMFLVRLAERFVDDDRDWVKIICKKDHVYVVDNLGELVPIARTDMFSFADCLIDGWGLSYDYISTFQPECICDDRVMTYNKESSGWYCKNCHGKITK